MMKLRMYNVAESEVVAFKNFDTPDIYYEFYPQVYTGKRGKCLFHSVKNMSLTLSSKLQYLLCTKDKQVKLHSYPHLKLMILFSAYTHFCQTTAHL